VQESRPVPATIDPRVLEDTANGQNGHFLVLLKQQAQPRKLLSAASDRASQGRLVVDALRSVAGSGCSTITDPPAFYDAAITVGATGYNTNNIASYSSRGPVTADGSGRVRPDLVAPGSGVRSS